MQKPEGLSLTDLLMSDAS